MSYVSFVYDLLDDRQARGGDTSDRIVMGVFFDGTCNNRRNVKARGAFQAEGGHKKKLSRLSKEAQAYKKHATEESSYENDHTNIDRLNELYIKKKGSEKVYIEGIGTTDLEADDILDGRAYGRDINGIRGKVRKACVEIAEKCPQKVKHITFDVFGFSRGAAAARNFVYEIFRTDGIMPGTEVIDSGSGQIDRQPYTTSYKVEKGGYLGYFLQEKNIPIKSISIVVRFVGLFDTVTSYDIKGLLKFKLITKPLFPLTTLTPVLDTVPEFETNIKLITKPLFPLTQPTPVLDTVPEFETNIKLITTPFSSPPPPIPVLDTVPKFATDIKLLHLNEVCSKAKTLIHLIASDEHRKNFAITPIKGGNKGLEIMLPGVHSNIGGGYLDGITEVKEISNEYSGIQNLEKLKEELIEEGWYKKEELEVEQLKYYNKLTGTRKNMNNGYTMISMRLVIAYAEKEKAKIFNLAKLKINYDFEEQDLNVVQNIKSFVREKIEDIIKINTNLDQLIHIPFFFYLGEPENNRRRFIADAIRRLLNIWNAPSVKIKFRTYTAPKRDEILPIKVIDNTRVVIDPIKELHKENPLKAKDNTRVEINHIKELYEEDPQIKLLYPKANELLYYFEQEIQKHALAEDVIDQQRFRYKDYNKILNSNIRDDTQTDYENYDLNEGVQIMIKKRFQEYDEAELRENLDFLVDEISEQLLLKALRSKYLYWSSNYKGAIIEENKRIIPDEPAVNRERPIHNA